MRNFKKKLLSTIMTNIDLVLSSHYVMSKNYPGLIIHPNGLIMVSDIKSDL